VSLSIYEETKTDIDVVLDDVKELLQQMEAEDQEKAN
jgi:hypothetical protein